jgi:hypothetical protein
MKEPAHFEDAALRSAAEQVSVAVPVSLSEFPPGWGHLAKAIAGLRDVLYVGPTAA